MIKTENGLTFTIQDLERADKPLRTYPYKDILEWLIDTYEDTEYISVEHPPRYQKSRHKKHGPIAYNQIDENLVSLGRHSFFFGLVSAYKQHRPIVLSPDMIWHLIIQGFSYHVEFNAEKLRHKFVDFEGKMTLIIVKSEHSPWEEIFPAFSQKISATFGQELVDTITADFSTTTATERIASQVILMHSVESYIEFLAMLSICGIPEVTLEGTPEDWEKVLKKAENLRKYDLDWWIDALKPVLEEFIKTAKGKIDLAFWKNIITYKNEGCIGGEEFDGWVVKFFPYSNDGQKLGLTALNSQQRLPNEIIKVPVKCVVKGITHNLEVWSGFFGLQQNEETYALKPQIGWMIRQCDESIQQTLDEHINKHSELAIRVKTIPDEILKLDSIEALHVLFIDKITIPEKLFTIPIQRLYLGGKISKTDTFRLRQKFPKTTRVSINGVYYPKDYIGFLLANSKIWRAWQSIMEEADLDYIIFNRSKWPIYWKIRAIIKKCRRYFGKKEGY